MRHPILTDYHQADGSCTVNDPGMLFYHDLPEAEQRQWIAMLRPQLRKTTTTPIPNVAYQHYPVTYLYCENDHTIPLELQKRMVETNGHNFNTETCSSGQPETVRKLLQSIAL